MYFKDHIKYMCTKLIVYTCCNEFQSERLQKLQNKTMRTTLEFNRYTSIEIELDTLK